MITYKGSLLVQTTSLASSILLGDETDCQLGQSGRVTG